MAHKEDKRQAILKEYGIPTDQYDLKGRPRFKIEIPDTYQGRLGVMVPRKRISRQLFFMEVAELCAQRSTCLHTHVGAVLVKDSQIIATGYNGSPRGMNHCTSCMREDKKIKQGERHELCRASHAEMNCIAQCARHGVNAKGAIMFSTHRPCSICVKLLVNSGVRIVVYKNKYKDELVDAFITEQKIRFDEINERIAKLEEGEVDLALEKERKQFEDSMISIYHYDEWVSLCQLEKLF